MRRVVLGDAVTRVQFENLGFIAGWIPVQTVAADGTHPYEQVWRAGASAVHYIEDDLLGVAYCVCLGPDEDSLGRHLSESLGAVTVSDVTGALSTINGIDARRHAIAFLAALGAQQAADSRIVDALTTALADPEREVRTAALFAVAYLSWPELDPALSRVAANDSDDGVRADAERTIRVIHSHRSG
ncbi:HEAT repeat domain-containing protein [Micromonospora sp. NPDC003197]